jgi:hypothetical protein
MEIERNVASESVRAVGVFSHAKDGAWELGGVRGESLQARASGKEAEAGAAATGEQPRRPHGHLALQRGKRARRQAECWEWFPRPQVPVREAFPSARQKRCAGLKRSYYPDYVREFVDYDYDESLPEAMRGCSWQPSRKSTTEAGASSGRLNSMASTHLRAAGAEQQRRRAHQDPLGFAAHRGTELVERPADRDVELEMVRALDERADRARKAEGVAPLSPFERRPRQPAHHAKQSATWARTLGGRMMQPCEAAPGWSFESP